MFPAEKSAISSAVVLLSSVISAIPHLPRSLTTPLGYVRRPSVCRDGHSHACRISPPLHVTAAPPRVGSLPRTPPVLRIIPEHQRGLHTGEASEACHGFTPPHGGRVSPGTAATHFPWTTLPTGATMGGNPHCHVRRC